MPLQRSDLPMLESGANSLMDLLVGNQNKLQQMQAAHSMGQQALDSNIQRAKALAKDQPGMGVSIGEGGNVSLSKPVDLGLQSLHKEKQGMQNIKQITGDYTKAVGNVPQQISAAENVKNAIASDNKLTLGRVKAQLPLLEGEKFRPTDAERKMMLTPSGAGSVSAFKNFFAGNDAQYDEPQRQALLGIIDQKLSTAKQQHEAAKNEVLKRYKSTIRSMSPDQMSDVAESLGLSTNEMVSRIENINPGQMKSKNILQVQPGNVLPSGIGISNQASANPSQDPMAQKKARYEELVRKKMGQ